MNPKIELQEIKKTVKNFKSTVRWLHRSNKKLWDKMIELTSFLSIDASAPQRAWHILNDVYEIQICKVSGKLLRWDCFETGYKKYGDKKTRYEATANSIKETIVKQGHWRNNDISKAEKANAKFSEGFKNGLHKPLSERSIDRKANTVKSKNTCLLRYGVDNYRKTKQMRTLVSELVYKRHLEAGGIPREQLPEKEKYYAEVWIHTDRSWYEHFYDINPENLQRNNKLHLDHIYSCQQGFLDRIPPEIIGHWTNLRLIDSRKNQSKKNKCDKTIEQLFEDFERENSKQNKN